MMTMTLMVEVVTEILKMIVNLTMNAIKDIQLNLWLVNSISSIQSKQNINRRDSCFSKRGRDFKRLVSMLRDSISIKKTEKIMLLTYLDQINFGLNLQIICLENLHLRISCQHSFLSVHVAILK